MYLVFCGLFTYTKKLLTESFIFYAMLPNFTHYSVLIFHSEQVFDRIEELKYLRYLRYYKDVDKRHCQTSVVEIFLKIIHGCGPFAILEKKIHHRSTPSQIHQSVNFKINEFEGIEGQVAPLNQVLNMLDNQLGEFSLRDFFFNFILIIYLQY